MSQAGIINISGGGGGGSPIETLTGNSGGPVPPTANNINQVGGTSSINDPNGITVIGSPGTSTLTFTLTNRISGNAVSVGAVTTSVITFPLSATPGTYTFDVSIAGFAIAGVGVPLGAGYTIVGAVRSDGATATLLPSEAIDSFEEGALAGNAASLAVSGNSVLIQVSGVAGYTIDWNGVGSYVFVS